MRCPVRLKWKLYEDWTPCTLTAGKINYKNLRKINLEVTRLAVIEYLSTNKGNIFDHLEPLVSKRT